MLRIKSRSLCHGGFFFLLLSILLCSCSKNDRPVLLEYLPQSVQYELQSDFVREKIEGLIFEVEEGKEPLLAFIELAETFHANGLLREAISSYEGLLQADPDNVKWPHLLATLLSGYGYGDDAAELWVGVIERKGDYLPARIRLGDLYLKSGSIDEAKDVYEDILDLDKRNPYAMVGLARISIQLKEWDAARVSLENAVEASGGRIGKDLLVTVYEALGRNVEAQAILSEAKASGSFIDIIDPFYEEVMEYCYDVDQLISMGGAASFRGDHQKGLGFYQKALAIDETDEMAHFQIAYVYEQLGKFDQAVRHLKRTVELKKSFSDAWIRYSALLGRIGRADESEKAFFRGFVNCPKSPAYQIEYARRLIRSDQHRAAIKPLKKSIELRPNEALAYIVLSTCYFKLGMVDSGAEVLRTALSVEAGNLTAMTTLCLYAIMYGEQEEAEKLLKQSEQHPRIDLVTLEELKGKYRKQFGE